MQLKNLKTVTKKSAKYIVGLRDKMDLFKDICDASNEIGESIHDATDAIKKLKKMPKSQWRKHVYLL